MRKKVVIIGEAGVNHNGSIELAKQLIDVAAEAGVDYIKFQTFKAENLVQKNAGKASYQINNTGDKDSQYLMLKKLELSEDNHHTLINYCKVRGVKFLSTAFDFDSIKFLKNKLDFYKIPSGEITNLLYLEKIAQLKLPIVMSTGMSTMEEVKEAYEILTSNGVHTQDITILHCNTEYPTPIRDVNLLAMKTIEKELGVAIGYSDHTLGIEVPIAAVAMGAQVIEKHFTLDRTMEGPDHKASLEPHELKAMVFGIRNIELAMGNGIKEPSNSEKKNIVIARKSIVALKTIKRGEALTESNITVKRPGSGISAIKWYKVLGTKAKKDYKVDEQI